ncbi:hypothetical protein BDZ94DRAFT_1317022 [Collybia nuda]|uniref:F-box domain-containing protein n=1 Tax=Collybia nuda TaxID=64659 RepID=A0A9P6CKF5_9AGAR|nr:hypothetical protein BDZ94DRAFT_1317022 [Collybia nuda]
MMAPRVGEHHLGPLRSYSCSSAIPTDVWEEIFIHCLPLLEDPRFLPTDNTLFTPHVAPLLICQVCREWRQLAISLPRLWSFLKVVVSLGESHPPIGVITLWLKRSGTVPLALSLFQTNESEGNQVTTGTVLEIFKHYIHRWQHVRLDLASSLRHDRLRPHKRKAPLLEQLHMRYQRPEETTGSDPLEMFEEFPRLSTLSLPSITPIRFLADLGLTVPWNQLTYISIGHEVSVGKVLLLLTKCHTLKNCKFDVESIPDTGPRSMITHASLQSLELTSGPQGLADFLRMTTFPALNNIVVYEKGSPAELLAWPQEELNMFLERSATRLHHLGLHNTCIRSTHFIDLLRNPSLQTLTELVVVDNTDWIYSPCLSFSAMEMLTFGEHYNLLPALQCLRISGLGCLWSVDSKALVDMAESRCRRYEASAAARLRILQVQISLSEFPADYRRLKQLQKEGLDLEVNTSF